MQKNNICFNDVIQQKNNCRQLWWSLPSTELPTEVRRAVCSSTKQKLIIWNILGHRRRLGQAGQAARALVQYARNEVGREGAAL